MRIRFLILFLFFTFLYFALIFNIYGLQIKKNTYYIAKAESQSRLAGFLEARRGNIYFTDKNNNLIPAAINKEFPVVFAIPKEISDPIGAASKLALLLNINQEKLINSLSKPNDPYEPILKKAIPEQVEIIKNSGLRGIYIDQREFRFYPFGSLASQVLGFLSPTAENSSISGKYGIEKLFDNLLAGQNGRTDRNKIIEPANGKDIILTIDPNIQTQAEDTLANLVKKFKGESGSVIVADPKTGKILALGNYPSFDPNNYSEYQIKDFLNSAVQGIYEPGSVFKVITMAAGLDSNKITPDTTFVDAGSLTLNGYTIKNWDKKAHGKVTMTEVIEQSINTGAAFAERQIGKDLFYKYIADFGFAEPTGIDLPGEVAGDLNNLKSSFREINFATAAFGQGVAVTPMELISAVSAIANKGILMKPYIISGKNPKIRRKIISEEAARKVIAMMVSAVKKAQIAQIPKYDIAGKTGTAQIPDLKRGGYEDNFIHTFVGFAPAYDPKFIILLKLDKPANAPLAGLTVVPAFKDLAEFILNYYNVPPDHLE